MKARNKFYAITFIRWMHDAPSWIFESSGRRNAFEYGAKAAMGARDHGAIYRRADCLRAERDGREFGGRAVSYARQGDGPAISCDCRGQLFPQFGATEDCK